MVPSAANANVAAENSKARLATDLTFIISPFANPLELPRWSILSIAHRFAGVQPSENEKGRISRPSLSHVLSQDYRQTLRNPGVLLSVARSRGRACRLG